MLICTNDGFVGLNNVRLPQGFRTIMRRGHAYDAGTELNDELFTSIVDPCGAIGPVAAPADGLNDRTATPDEVVRMHRGIRGGGDLFPDDHGWEGPAAKITIRRIPMERIYRVSIENLTSSQPFSPGVVATHVARQRLFRVGHAASEGVRLIAENGDPSVAESEFPGARGVHDVVGTAAPIHRIGGPCPNTLSVEVAALGRANFLSLSVMLICTNDGFAGLPGVWLPVGWEPRTYWARSYDSGTELNDELFTSIVDPCGGIGPVAAAPDGENNRTPTQGVVRPHRRIHGVGDLFPDDHGWNDPVAKVVVQRIQ